MRKKLLALLMCVTVSAMVLAGCGGKDESSKKAKTSSEESSSEDIEEEGSDEDSQEEATYSGFSLTELEPYMTCCYQGITDSEDTYMYYATNDDVTFSVLVVWNKTDNQYYSVVGNSTNNGDGTVTIEDNKEGVTFTFGVTNNGDETYTLDCGNAGSALVETTTSEEVLDNMQKINDNAEEISLADILEE